MTHLGYIVAAYALAAAVIVLLVAWIRIDTARQRRRLARLETGGGAKR